MIRLTREIRFSLVPEDGESLGNAWAASPGSESVAPFIVLRATLTGEPDPQTGYLCNIKAIDHVLRRFGVALLRRAEADRIGPLSVGPQTPSGIFRLNPSPAESTPVGLLRALWLLTAQEMPEPAQLSRLELATTPYLKHALRKETRMVYLTQQFEFSAAHRLHAPQLSDEQNRATFGKCNNPNGHGHNYIVEVTLASPAQDGVVFPLPQFETAVKERVIDRFDHKHLNADTAEFRSLNPTVENIARVVFELLKPALPPLHSVKVWETPKTSAEYGPA